MHVECLDFGIEFLLYGMLTERVKAEKNGLSVNLYLSRSFHSGLGHDLLSKCEFFSFKLLTVMGWRYLLQEAMLIERLEM